MIRGGGFATQLSFREKGYQERFDPDKDTFDLNAGVDQMLSEFKSFPPDVVVCASRGGVYMRELWRRLEVRDLLVRADACESLQQSLAVRCQKNVSMSSDGNWTIAPRRLSKETHRVCCFPLQAAGDGGLCGWKGASVMINVARSCKALPKGYPVVIAQGANDSLPGFFGRCTRKDSCLETNSCARTAPAKIAEAQQAGRAALETLVRTAGCSSAFLYYTADGLGRTGDTHNMKTLVEPGLECLPRLIDGALSGNPEFSFQKSWRGLLSEERRGAEDLLGHMPIQVRRPSHPAQHQP